MYEDIEEILKQNPGAHIYYHDNGAWIIYKEVPVDFEHWTGDPGDYDKYLASIAVMEGDDFTSNVGYCPSIVAALAEICGFTVDSI